EKGERRASARLERPHGHRLHVRAAARTDDPRLAQTQAAPGNLPGPARSLQELGHVPAYSGGQEHLLPGRRGRFPALQQRDGPEQSTLPAERIAGLEVVPAEQEPHEILRGEWLDLAPQAAHREPVDPLEEATIAPLEFLGTRPKSPSQDLTLGLEPMECER